MRNKERALHLLLWWFAWQLFDKAEPDGRDPLRRWHAMKHLIAPSFRAGSRRMARAMSWKPRSELQVGRALPLLFFPKWVVSFVMLLETLWSTVAVFLHGICSDVRSRECDLWLARADFQRHNKENSLMGHHICCIRITFAWTGLYISIHWIHREESGAAGIRFNELLFFIIYIHHCSVQTMLWYTEQGQGRVWIHVCHLLHFYRFQPLRAV